MSNLMLVWPDCKRVFDRVILKNLSMVSKKMTENPSIYKIEVVNKGALISSTLLPVFYLAGLGSLIQSTILVPVCAGIGNFIITSCWTSYIVHSKTKMRTRNFTFHPNYDYVSIIYISSVWLVNNLWWRKCWYYSAWLWNNKAFYV